MCLSAQVLGFQTTKTNQVQDDSMYARHVLGVKDLCNHFKHEATHTNACAVVLLRPLVWLLNEIIIILTSSTPEFTLCKDLDMDLGLEPFSSVKVFISHQDSFQKIPKLVLR